MLCSNDWYSIDSVKPLISTFTVWGYRTPSTTRQSSMSILITTGSSKTPTDFASTLRSRNVAASRNQTSGGGDSVTTAAGAATSIFGNM